MIILIDKVTKKERLFKSIAVAVLHKSADDEVYIDIGIGLTRERLQ